MADAQLRGALWDMDGTLVDTAELHFQAWVQMCHELGRSFDRRDFAATFGKRNVEIMAYLYGDTIDAAEVERVGNRKEELYRQMARKGVSLLPGAGELMEELHKQGFRQGIGSSAPRANLELILELTGIDRFLGAVVSAEDTTRGKPDPQVFLVGAQRLGVEPSKCVVFEDAIAGIQAAKAGGMKAVAVAFVGHHPPLTLLQAGADRVVHTLTDISRAEIEGLLA